MCTRFQCSWVEPFGTTAIRSVPGAALSRAPPHAQARSASSDSDQGKISCLHTSYPLIRYPRSAVIVHALSGVRAMTDNG